MVRPRKPRHICHEPSVTIFKPRGIPARELEMVIVGLDELEALRLADFEGLYQEEAANRMKVSRTTLSRLLDNAHKKVADALLNGKGIVLADHPPTEVAEADPD